VGLKELVLVDIFFTKIKPVPLLNNIILFTLKGRINADNILQMDITFLIFVPDIDIALSSEVQDTNLL
jgi:hypothetical protein